MIVISVAYEVRDTAREAVELVQRGECDVGFFAIDPTRSSGVFFTEPYVLIEGAYLVRDNSHIQRNEDVDCLGVTVAVGHGSAYDLYLSRHLVNATIVRAPTSPKVVDFFQDHEIAVAAGVKQQLQADAARIGGLRLLPSNFMTIKQAMSTHGAAGEQGAEFVGTFVRNMLRSGRIARLAEEHGVKGVTIPV